MVELSMAYYWKKERRPARFGPQVSGLLPGLAPLPARGGGKDNHAIPRLRLSASYEMLVSIWLS